MMLSMLLLAVLIQVLFCIHTALVLLEFFQML
jgi:hypothetical protein